MAIHLNLYHEIQKQARQRRRDPLKLGMLGMIVGGICFLAYYFYRMEQVRVLNDELTRLQTEWQTTEPKFNAATAREVEITATIKTTDALVQAIEGRFYWAPLLEKVLSSVPREVQITKLDGEMADKTRSGGLSVSGISSGGEPRKVAEDLRTTFVNKLSEKYKNVSSTFKSLEDTEQPIQLNGKALATAMFAMQFQISTAPETNLAPAAERKRATK